MLIDVRSVGFVIQRNGNRYTLYYLYYFYIFDDKYFFYALPNYTNNNYF